ncbi:MAG: glycosyltransferase family 2 protein [Gammaproteobacteria bacterium]|nr:glycosyltransferase family 2 protein [Gammaproteobacteria bacterium]
MTSTSRSAQLPLVSVVTPVYNGGEYLRACLDSVCAQTYSNWRYTIVDNCSSDDTFPLAESYAARDSRVRVLRQSEFLPLIANHNRALRLIDPDSVYCKPLMADDWLYPECLEQLVAAACAHPSAGLICSSARSGDHVLFDGLPPTHGAVSFLDGRTAARLGLLEERYFFGSPTTQLLRTDQVRKRDPFYNPENPQADEEACYDLLRECDFVFVHQPLVYVRMHARSHTSSLWHLFSLESCHVYALAKYGPDFLKASEYQARLQLRLRQYYARLALGVVEGRGPDFWRFHRRLLQMIGQPLSRVRLARAIAAHIARKLAAPRALLRSVGRRMGRIRGRSAGADQ